MTFKFNQLLGGFMESKQVQDLPLGEFVKRKADSHKVYKRVAYCKANKAYQLDDMEDISRAIYVKKGTILFYGFTY